MDVECPICLSPSIGTITITGCCKKQFHANCFLQCMQQKGECPLCRSKEFIIEIGNETPIIIEKGVHQGALILLYLTTIVTVMYVAQFFK